MQCARHLELTAMDDILHNMEEKLLVKARENQEKTYQQRDEMNNTLEEQKACTEEIETVTKQLEQQRATCKTLQRRVGRMQLSNTEMTDLIASMNKEMRKVAKLLERRKM